MTGCSGIKNYINLEELENDEYRLNEFVKTIHGALKGRENEEYSVQNFAFIVRAACNKVSDMFKSYEDIVITSKYVLPLVTEKEAYTTFEESVANYYSDYENELLNVELLYRKLVIAHDNLTNSIESKSYVKSL